MLGARGDWTIVDGKDSGVTLPLPKRKGSSWQRILAVMFFAQMITLIGFASIIPFLSLYVKSLGVRTPIGTDLLAGLAFSAQAVTMMLSSPIWGAVSDRKGRKLMVERSMFGGAVVVFLMAWVQSAEELVVLRAVQGMVTGTIGATNALVAATAPRGKTGYAMGVMQVSMGLGIGLGPVMGGLVADAFGYRAAFYVTGVLLLISGVIVYYGFDEGFTPPALESRNRDSFWRQWQKILSLPGVTATYTIRFFHQSGVTLILPVLPLFVAELIDAHTHLNSFAGLVIGASSAATTLFAIMLGKIGDRIGHRIILVISSLGCCVTFALQIFVTNEWQLLLLQILSGMTIGGIIPGISALLAQYTPSGEEGVVYGLDNSVNSAARALGPMLGVSISLWLGFRAVFATVALFFLMNVLLALAALPRKSPIRRDKNYIVKF